MDYFRIAPLGEPDIDGVIDLGGGRRPDKDPTRRTKPGADYVFHEAVIELKLLDEEGFDKPARQAKLAALFRPYDAERPVIVLDRDQLDGKDQRTFDTVVGGPVKRAVSDCREQLSQSRQEHPETTTSILLVINNGYTALDHDQLVELVGRRARNDTTQIDGVVVAGCYFYSDTFDSYFLWPMDYLPINLDRPFPSFDRLRSAWHALSEKQMTSLVRGEVDMNATKGPVVDLQFEMDGITYVKPTPPMGRKSDFFINGRPREGDGVVEGPVAITFPDMTFGEWGEFRKAIPYDLSLGSSYEEWLRSRAKAVASCTPTCPLVPMPVRCVQWLEWCQNAQQPLTMRSVRAYANDLFNAAATEKLKRARPLAGTVVRPARYVLAATEEIGQRRANDLSEISMVVSLPDGSERVRKLVSNARLFHEGALLLACACAIAEDIECVFWGKGGRYRWE